ncbi:MAG: L-carnitine dehydrogenase [Alphaproteobacteria bacterium]|nr:L-carnitine dehydrogenase [Alphaproteobacteria bacterium]
MARPEPSAVKRVGLVGAGLIGSGWASYFLSQGIDVVATDPHPDGEARVRASVANAWPALTKVGLKPGADQKRLTFIKDIETAIRDVDFIQESATENEDLKTELMARIDRAARPDAIIASSTSGLLPSRFQRTCKHPERVLVGHPFNPVYLLPLVEVVGGEKTTEANKDWAVAFYNGVGKRALRCRKEVPGFVSDRLQEALWREALHLINDGVGTTEEVDAAVRYGPGLRWAFMGSFLTYHLAGGDDGMAHFIEQFGPALDLPWTSLQGPAMSKELTRRLVDGTREQAAGKSVKDMERRRDETLIAIMQAIHTHWDR